MQTLKAITAVSVRVIWRKLGFASEGDTTVAIGSDRPKALRREREKIIKIGIRMS